MLFNIKFFSKLIRVALSCRTLEHTDVTYAWATRLVESGHLTRFEYTSVIGAILRAKNNIKLKHGNNFI